MTSTVPLAMPAEEARRILARLGWTQAYAADRLGIAPRTMRQYLERGASLPPTHAELLRHLSKERCAAELRALIAAAREEPSEAAVEVIAEALDCMRLCASANCACRDLVRDVLSAVAKGE